MAAPRDKALEGLSFLVTITPLINGAPQPSFERSFEWNQSFACTWHESHRSLSIGQQFHAIREAVRKSLQPKGKKR